MWLGLTISLRDVQTSLVSIMMLLRQIVLGPWTREIGTEASWGVIMWYPLECWTISLIITWSSFCYCKYAMVSVQVRTGTCCNYTFKTNLSIFPMLLFPNSMMSPIKIVSLLFKIAIGVHRFSSVCHRWAWYCSLNNYNYKVTMFYYCVVVPDGLIFGTVFRISRDHRCSFRISKGSSKNCFWCVDIKWRPIFTVKL